MKKNQSERQVEKIELITEAEDRKVDSHLERAIKTLDQVMQLIENHFEAKGIKKIKGLDVNLLLEDISNSIDDLSDIQVLSDMGTIQTTLSMPNFEAQAKLQERKREINNVNVLNQFVSGHMR